MDKLPWEIKCNCGRDSRYLHKVGEEEVMSCNKHIVCPTYEELLLKRDEYHRDMLQALKMADTLINCKETSFHYTDATDRWKALMKKYMTNCLEED
jgi:hypothetical protein